MKEKLLRVETRRIVVLELLRSILKYSFKQIDPVVRNYLINTAVYSFKLEKDVHDIERMCKFIVLQEDLLSQLKSTDFNASVYIVNLAYGQVVFTPRNDDFLQAKYVNKLAFGKKSTPPLPYTSSVHILGKTPLPLEYTSHIRNLLKSHPNLESIYNHLVS